VLMLTYPKLTMRVWRIPTHLSSGHVTLMPGKFYAPPNFPQLDLGRRADSTWALPQISSLKRTWTRTWTCPFKVDLDLAVAGLVTSLVSVH